MHQIISKYVDIFRIYLHLLKYFHDEIDLFYQLFILS